MKKTLYILLYLILTACWSCYEDKGNYDYNRFPELKIEDMESDYGTRILFKDSLVIEPQILFGEEDESSFDMHWYEVKDTLVPVADGKDLKILLQEAGHKEFLFEAIHKDLGISIRKRAKVIVSSQMQRGFYILKETAEGNTELDGHIRTGVDEYYLMPDLLTQKLGQPLEGKPVALDYWDWKNPNPLNEGEEFERVIRPVSEKDIAIIRMSDFVHLGGISELFYDLRKGDLTIEFIRSIPEMTLIIYNNGRLRVMPNDMVSHFQMEINGDYELMPALASSSSGAPFLYDRLTSSFKSSGATTTKLGILPDRSIWGNKVPPMNNTGCDLLFLGRGDGNIGIMQRNAGIAYALMSDNRNHNRYLYHMTLAWNKGWMQNSTNPIERVDSLSPSLNLNRSKMFAMHAYEKVMYFTLGNRVFAYDLKTGLESLLVGEDDYTGGRMPEEITYLKYVRCNYDNPDYRFDRLFVGGYRDGHYSLFAFKVIAGKISGEPLVWEGEGRIKDIRYTTLNSKVQDCYIWQ